MNGKCAMDSINGYMHILGLILLGFILIIVVIYFYNNVVKKHSNIVEKYATADRGSTIMDEMASYGDDGKFNEHKESELDTYEIDENNKIFLRRCEVFFVGEEDETKASGHVWLLVDKSRIDTMQAKGYGNVSKLDETRFKYIYDLMRYYFNRKDTENVTNPSIENISNNSLSHFDSSNYVYIIKYSNKAYIRSGHNLKYLVYFKIDGNGNIVNKNINQLFNNNSISTFNYIEIDLNGTKYYLMPFFTKNQSLINVCRRKMHYDKTNTCGYKFDGAWNEISHTITKDADGKMIRTYYPHKIYNQSYTNYNKDNSQNMMKSCFKLVNDNGINIKFNYDANGVLQYDYSGKDSDNAINMKTNLTKDGIGSYINMNFENSDDTDSNYKNIITSICSLKHLKIKDDNLNENTKYIKFILDRQNNVQDVHYVSMNKDQSGFNIRSSEDRPKLIEDAAFGMMLTNVNFDHNSGRHSLHFKLFKSIDVPTIQDVEIFKFTYNYLCDNSITHFHRKTAKLNLGNMIIPPDPNIQYSSKEIIYYFDDLGLDSEFWNQFTSVASVNVNSPVNQKFEIIRAINDKKKEKLSQIRRKYNETNGTIQNKIQNVSEPFTNYTEHFRVKDIKDYYTDSEINKMGIEEAEQAYNAWSDFGESQKTIQTSDMSKNLGAINQLERREVNDPYGNQIISDSHKPFNFTKGFHFKIIQTDKNSVYSAKNKFSTIEALNNNIPITLVNNTFLKLTNPGIKRAEIAGGHHWWRNSGWAWRQAAAGVRLHPRHNWYWHEGGYWPGAWRLPPLEKHYRGGTRHHPANLVRWRRWLVGRGKVDSWRIMKNKIDNNRSLISPITYRTGGSHYMNKPNHSHRRSLYAQIYHTYFLAPETGKYTWRVVSDDAGMLFVKQVFPKDSSAKFSLLVDNGRLHGPKPEYGYIDMKKGYVYELHGTFNERYGHDVFKMGFKTKNYNNGDYVYNVYSNMTRNSEKVAHYYQNASFKSEETLRFENIKWAYSLDGSFIANIKALEGRPFNLNKVKFGDSIVGTTIQQDIYTSITLNDAELSKYYNFYVKGNDKHLFFKVTLTTEGLETKFNKVAQGDNYNENENSLKYSYDYSSHIDVLDNPDYFNVKDREIKSSIPPEVMIDPWAFVRFVVCGYIYLDAGNYRFYVNNNIPKESIYKDNKFILQGKNHTQLLRINENNKDIKVKVSGFYKWSHNCFVQNVKHTVIGPNDYQRLLSEVQEVGPKNLSKRETFDELNRIFNYPTYRNWIITTVNSAIRPGSIVDFIYTIIEYDMLEKRIMHGQGTGKNVVRYVVNDNESQDELEDKISRKRATITAQETVRLAEQYVKEVLYTDRIETYGDSIEPIIFKLSCDYEDLDGNNKVTNRDLSNVLFTGERMYNFYNEYNNETLFNGISAFNKNNGTNYDGLEPFTNYNEHFTDEMASYLDNAKGRGKDFHYLTGINTVKSQLSGLIEQKRKKRDEELDKVGKDFDYLLQQLNRRINYKNYFSKYIVQINKNANIASIVNNSSENGAKAENLTLGEKSYIYNHITFEKIKTVNNRTTPDSTNVNYNYRDYSDRSFYVLESSVTGE